MCSGHLLGTVCAVWWPCCLSESAPGGGHTGYPPQLPAACHKDMWLAPHCSRRLGRHAEHACPNAPTRSLPWRIRQAKMHRRLSKLLSETTCHACPQGTGALDARSCMPVLPCRKRCSLSNAYLPVQPPMTRRPLREPPGASAQLGDSTLQGGPPAGQPAWCDANPQVNVHIP